MNYCLVTDPMVTFSMGYISKYWDLRIGRWVNNMKTQFHYPKEKTQILEQCKAVRLSYIL